MRLVFALLLLACSACGSDPATVYGLDGGNAGAGGTDAGSDDAAAGAAGATADAASD